MKQPTRTIQLLEVDEFNRIATIDLGAVVPGTTGQLFAEFNRLKKPEHAAVALVTPIRPDAYIIQAAPEGEFMNAVGCFIHAGVSLLDWLCETVEVVEIRVVGNRSWSLGTTARPKWELIQPE